MKFDQFQTPTSRNNTQQHTTWCANARNMLGPTMLRLVCQQCCEHLHGLLIANMLFVSKHFSLSKVAFMNSSCFIICELNWVVFMAIVKH